MANMTKEEILAMQEEERESIESQKAIKKQTYWMYDKTYKETDEKRKALAEKEGRTYPSKNDKDTLKLIENMQKDAYNQFIALGGTEEELLTPPSTTTTKKGKISKDTLKKIKSSKEENISLKNETKQKAMRIIEDMETSKEDESPKKVTKKVTPIDEKNTSYPESFTYDINTNKKVGNILFDEIPIPSHGECYKHKKNRVPVSYLTAYDENLIVSPNLYDNGTFIDQLLSQKIMSDKFDPEDMLPGDRDAIILWLRASGYGVNFPATATDSETGKQFSTTIDLSQIKFKPFKLIGDEDGCFDFTLPITKDVVKFKFLTYKDIKELEKYETEENDAVKKEKINEIIENIEFFVDNDKKLDKVMKTKLNSMISTLGEYRDEIETEEQSFTHAVTNKLIKSIHSINDITDSKFIGEYVLNMNVRDSSALRKYITENEPGLDFNVTVERPESLGGGSVTMFLTLDQYLFLIGE